MLLSCRKPPPAEPIAASARIKMIELKHITKQFHKNKTSITALSDVSLTVPEGKILGVIGESGAGKSTLIRCVNLLEKPGSGEVWVDGQNMMTLAPHALRAARSRIGMIFQHFNLLSSRTVSDNIALPLKLQKRPPQEITQRVTELLVMVGLEDKRADYPASLSGGQKQRVAIARALASNPTVLLCDEATSSLDPGTTQSILALLKDINARMKITILLITHEMEVVKSICDDVAVISGGRLVEQGTVGEVFSRPSSPVTRKFIESSLKVEVPANYRLRLSQNVAQGKHPLIRMEFNGQSLEASVMSEVSRRFGVDNHIVSARIESAGGATFGLLIVELSGEDANVQRAIAFFQENNIKTEILGYV